MEPDGSASDESASVKREPIVFFAHASKNILTGELIEFHVDGWGFITSSKLKFDPATPRMRPGDGRGRG